MSLHSTSLPCPFLLGGKLTDLVEDIQREKKESGQSGIFIWVTNSAGDLRDFKYNCFIYESRWSADEGKKYTQAQRDRVKH